MPSLDTRRPIDADMLDRQTDGDAALKSDVLATFAAQAAALGEALAQDPDPATMFANLHHLRGSALAVGAADLSDVAAACEAALRRGGHLTQADLKRLWKTIAETCRYAAVLQAALAETSSPNGSKADKHLRPSMSGPGQREARDAES